MDTRQRDCAGFSPDFPFNPNLGGEIRNNVFCKGEKNETLKQNKEVKNLI